MVFLVGGYRVLNYTPKAFSLATFPRVKTKGFIKTKSLGWAEEWILIYICLPPAGGRIRSQGNIMRRRRNHEWAEEWRREGGGWAEGGGCGFSSLMKQEIKGKNCAVFCFAGKRKILFLYL
jgi:hypothetical protein